MRQARSRNEVIGVCLRPDVTPGKFTAQFSKRPWCLTVAMGTAAALSLPTGWSATRAGYCGGGAGRAVEHGDLFRQLGLDRRHRAGRRQGVARRHDGLAQHVAIACNPTDRRRPPIDSPDCGITHRLTITVDVSKRVRRPFGVPTR